MHTYANSVVAGMSRGSVLLMAKSVQNAIKCNQKNHFAKQCFLKSKSTSVRLVEETDLSETFFLLGRCHVMTQKRSSKTLEKIAVTYSMETHGWCLFK